MPQHTDSTSAVAPTSPHSHEDVSAPQDKSQAPRAQGVTLRVTILCLLLAMLFGWVIPIIDVKLSNTFLGAAHLPPGAIAVLLFVLLLLNPILRVLGRRFMLSRNETLTVYISCLFSCLVPGHGSENFFIGSLVAPFYYAKPENKWMDFLGQYLKPWFTPALNAGGTNEYGEAGRSVVDAWFTGVRPGDAIPLGAWILPLFLWGAFVFASYIMLGCLGVMLRAQWAQREALAFPLLRLPLEMTEDVDAPQTHGVLGRFFKSSTMWVGFGIAVFIQAMNGLHLYFPDVPEIPLSINAGALFTEPPWNQMGGVEMGVFPIVVGVTYLLTSEVSFSLWFFFLFIKLQLIAAYMTGFLPSTLPGASGHTMSAKAFTSFQTVGAFWVYVALVLWTGREHFAHIAKRAFGKEASTREERKEAMSYPVAFWGFVASFLFLVGWSVAAGMSFSVATALWLSYLVIALALTRVVVEGGLLFVQQGWEPLNTFAQMAGSGPGRWLSPESIVPGAFIQTGMMTDLRAFLLPSFVQSFKLARDQGIHARKLIWLIFAVVAITMAMGFYQNVMLGYKHGGLSLNAWFAVAGAQAPANNANDMINGVRDVSLLHGFWLIFGGALTYAMVVARSRLAWFPLHPVGYLMCLSYPMYKLWFSIFVGWLCKGLISRFGGTETYRNLTPLFLGLALGDVAMMLMWLVVDGFFGRTAHQLMPG